MATGLQWVPLTEPGFCLVGPGLAERMAHAAAVDPCRKCEIGHRVQVPVDQR